MGFEVKDNIEKQAKDTIDRVIEKVKVRNIGESEFHQTIEEVLQDEDGDLVFLANTESNI